MENKFINVNEAYEHNDLACWYQNSVDDTPPIWTDEHLEELLNDFYVIPKDTPTADVVEVSHGEWELEYVYANDYSNDNVRKVFRCSICGRIEKQKEPYCNCGAKMDGDMFPYDSWIITENGCVITCPKCGERLELCYPDGTEVRYLPHCPWCGKKLEK